MPGEFDVIARYFTHSPKGTWKSQGVGDDCALVDTQGEELAITMDQMAIGTHFLPDANPESVGYKALAVNLSDLAAAGATPRAFFLGLGLPKVDESWLAAFSKGMMSLANEYQCDLLGGDTTRTPTVKAEHAPVTINITAMGAVPKGQGLTRSGAQVGDDIWVSGTLGDAYAALMLRWGKWTDQVPEPLQQYLFDRMDRPTARVQLGIALRGIATACADVSDGLLADLGHILDRSQVAAEIEETWVPRSQALSVFSEEKQRQATLKGGDDYELVFTANSQSRQDIERISDELGLRLTRIGTICRMLSGDNLVIRSKGVEMSMSKSGFDHFSNS